MGEPLIDAYIYLGRYFFFLGGGLINGDGQLACLSIYISCVKLRFGWEGRLVGFGDFLARDAKAKYGMFLFFVYLLGLGRQAGSV